MRELPRHPPTYRLPDERRVARRSRIVWTFLPVQVVLTGFLVYVVIAIWTVLGGAYMEGLQIIGFAFVSTPITVGLFLLGLPLRVVPAARAQWLRGTRWMLVVLGAGVLGLAVSYVVGSAGPTVDPATPDHVAVPGYIPDPGIFVVSLGTLGFTSMHLLRPPRGDLFES